MALSLSTLLLIISQTVEQHYLLWIAYGAFSSFGTLVYTQTSAGFPVKLSGRANTTLNLLVFLGAFGLQWGMGLIIDLLQRHGYGMAIAHRDAFIFLFALQALAYLWFLAGGRSRSP